MGMDNMIRRPDLYDPAEAVSKDAENLKEKLQSDDCDIYG